MEVAGKADLKSEKRRKRHRKHTSVPKETGRKQSVLKALRERQAKLKAQDSQTIRRELSGQDSTAMRPVLTPGTRSVSATCWC